MYRGVGATSSSPYADTPASDYALPVDDAPVYGPTLAQLGVTVDAAGNYVRTGGGASNASGGGALSATVTAWLNKNASLLVAGAVGFVLFMAVSGGGRGR